MGPVGARSFFAPEKTVAFGGAPSMVISTIVGSLAGAGDEPALAGDEGVEGAGGGAATIAGEPVGRAACFALSEKTKTAPTPTASAMAPTTPTSIKVPRGPRPTS